MRRVRPSLFVEGEEEKKVKFRCGVYSVGGREKRSRKIGQEGKHKMVFYNYPENIAGKGREAVGKIKIF